jgi:menaquinone reductase, molybdopterin-binding-like subunit
MPFTRRDILFGLGGGLAGVAFTPVPWKLLDDTAIWTQRRHAIPVPPRGPVTFRSAACTLCPAGCALRVRCVGPRPVAVAGEGGHPLGGGACAFGLTLHHLAYHPLRLTGPAVRTNGRTEALALDAAVGNIARAVQTARTSGQKVMVLDRRPGRVVSTAWRELMDALPHGPGLYATHPGESETLAVLQRAVVPAGPGALGLDLEKTRTLVSFGAPVLDGWGRPARVLAARKGLRVVQIDTWRSPSAALADEWIAIPPGAEGPLALALAQVIVSEEKTPVGEDVRRALAGFSPVRAAALTGVAAEKIEALARELVRQSPAVAIGGGDPGSGPLPQDAERAIALLDVVLGSVGREGGFVPRRPLPEAADDAARTGATTLADVPAGSVGVLFLDAADDGRALPWPLLRRTLAKDAVVVSLSPFDGPLAGEAGVLVPAPAPLEAWDEVLPTADASVASYAISAPVLPVPPGATDTVAFLQSLASALKVEVGKTTHEERLHARVAAIRSANQGRLVARTDTGYAEQATADANALWTALVAGGCWIDERQGTTPVETRAPLPSAAAREAWSQPDAVPNGLRLVATAARGAAGTTPASPLLSKLYQESDLRPATATVAMSPSTAQQLSLSDRRPVRIESPNGAVRAELRIDPTLPPGRVALAAGPDPASLHPGTGVKARGALPLAVAGADGTWRETRVRVEEA